MRLYDMVRSGSQDVPVFVEKQRDRSSVLSVEYIREAECSGLKSGVPARSDGLPGPHFDEVAFSSG